MMFCTTGDATISEVFCFDHGCKTTPNFQMLTYKRNLILNCGKYDKHTI